MCVAYLSYQQRADWPLFIASNRDEFYERPNQGAHFWEEESNILGGRDLKSGGAWFAVHRDGRWAILTNYRDPKKKVFMPRSRGLLLRDYLLSKESAEDFSENIKTYTSTYSYEGFSILWGNREHVYFYSNVNQEVQKLPGGFYGLSNHLLDNPWPKIVDGKRDLAKLLQEPEPPSDEMLFSFLQDPSTAEDQRLPNTGVSREWERILSARFIVSPDYGTRASTLLCFHASGKIYFAEQNYGPGGKEESRQKFFFS